MKLRIYAMFTGLTGIGVGLPYVVRIFGPTEAEVVLWGKAAILTGLFGLKS